jgi:hypothetical protein
MGTVTVNGPSDVGPSAFEAFTPNVKVWVPLGGVPFTRPLDEIDIHDGALVSAYDVGDGTPRALN